MESALAELTQLIGLEPVKAQVRAIAAQLEVAKMRGGRGLISQPPTRHFVFLGPPGTGKTTVARILGRIFAAQGLLVRPEVVEAQRGDLVGEHLGATAIKTSKLVDSALGGVLFVDEAYSLHNEGYSGGDAFGNEAVQTLLKRAEDDRDRLVIVLAGYPADMDRFLRSNPGLSSRFSTRIEFPSYTPDDLVRITGLLSQQAGDSFDLDAEDMLERIFEHAGRDRRIDELGNGRFARSLFERACAHRDVRVVRLGETATAEDLTTVTGDDLRAASPGARRRPRRRLLLACPAPGVISFFNDVPRRLKRPPQPTPPPTQPQAPFPPRLPPSPVAPPASWASPLRVPRGALVTVCKTVTRRQSDSFCTRYFVRTWLRRAATGPAGTGSCRPGAAGRPGRCRPRPPRR